MKKHSFVFIVLCSLVLLSACQPKDQNTVRFNNEAATETETTKPEAPEPVTGETNKAEDSKESAPVTSQPQGQLTVTSIEGGFLKTKQSYNVIRGTVPSGTQSIKINNYQLKQYIPGQTTWSYIASTRFGTLNAGLNNYVVKSYDGSGKETGSLMFSIQYEGPVLGSDLPAVGVSQWIVLSFSMMAAMGVFLVRRLRWL